jgi:DNA-binding NarL/FixJ family response regulator
MSIRIGVIEDNPGIRQAWASLIAAEPGFEFAGGHASGEAALAAFPLAPPDVVLVDLGLPGMSGIECILRMKTLLPDARLLVVTIYTDNGNLFDALKAGADGYIVKHTEMSALARSIREVAEGGSPMSAGMARRVIEAFRVASPAKTGLVELSPRERDVLGWLARGLVVKEIAVKLGLSHQTVWVHLRNIYKKLHVNSRSEAVSKWLSSGGA